ncbi:hypothetical protein Q7M76_05225 [Candidatus Liberibacter asiaticus]|nr:hypothetical protein [Candidatus Liberibacter asiaticus]KAE9509690.1 hypothetical protein FXW22_05145 [Candidatus Liberibacter asiaticus]KAE9511548.1 hypothetical protein FXW31_00945 [Candidatus Liberibacter asiaticus]KAE9511773.1 hypothetical protein FXW32_05130 [Candidatus Liberibacter asiaticus]KAE9512875.1 hypothetical protein FXW35_05180 [Candidatus Liberibacter asiaticus]KAE9513950.1 hypothetical protein FXW25_05160 [Candidatus Liberibacter asiaticus]
MSVGHHVAGKRVGMVFGIQRAVRCSFPELRLEILCTEVRWFLMLVFSRN